VEIVKRPHATNLVRWAKDKPNVLVLTADLTSSCEADGFRDAYPERYFSLGVAEQNMMSFAAGMAREGFFPYVHTFAVFITRQSYHQIAVSIAYPNLPVRMVGFLPGIVTPGGMTHQATDDIALMRTLPNMTILECADATEVESVLDIAQAVNGPVYIRMLRGEVPRLFPMTEPMQLDQARVLSSGEDVAVLTSGICTEEALRAIHVLRSVGVGVQHLHISTLKPFTDPLVLRAITSCRYGVVTLENHTTIGGLGSAVSELITDLGLGKKLIRLGLQDVFAHGASKPYLMKKYCLDAMALIHAIERLMERKLEITESDLAEVRLTAVHNEAKVEAL
jgi:transketolase